MTRRILKAELAAQNAELRAKVSEQSTTIEALRASLRAVENELHLLKGSLSEPRVQSPSAEKLVCTYTKRDGTRMGKFRTGFNTYTHRVLSN